MGQCYLWTGYTASKGYGALEVEGKQVKAHRWLWIQLRGSIPEGLILDHQCHNLDLLCLGGECHHRRCVNLEHLRITTHEENVKSGKVSFVRGHKTHCVKGHEYLPETTGVTSKGDRKCLVCYDEWVRARQVAALRRKTGALDT